MKTPAPGEPKRHEAVRLRHTIRLWSELRAARRLPPLDRWLADRLKTIPGAGKRDRSWYSERFFGVVRYGERIRLLIAARQLLRSSRVRDAAHAIEQISANWGQDNATQLSGQAAFGQLARNPMEELIGWADLCLSEGDPWKITVPLSDAERNQIHRLYSAAASAIPGLDALHPASLSWYGLGPQWAPALHARIQASRWNPKQLRQWLQVQVQRAPLWARVQQPEDLERVVEELEAMDFAVVVDGLSLRIEGVKSLYNSAPYSEGRIQIQDRASQAMAETAEVQPGESVWDCCAGEGGKTMALAAHAGGRGYVLATDSHRGRMSVLEQRVQRSHVRYVHTRLHDATTPLTLPREVAAGHGFDVVFVDAPCSSSGTWRRNPDARYRIDPQTVADFPPLQRTILARASQAVRPGGRLVYGTCSWFTQENEDVVRDFLALHPDFRLRVQRMLAPPQYDSDSMFVAVLQR